LIQTRQVQV